MELSRNTGIYCPRCDRGGVSSFLYLIQGSQVSGRAVKCSACGAMYEHNALMKLNPRMRKSEFLEKQPPGTEIVKIWVHPDAVAALRSRFPQNTLTTISAAVTSLADPDTVLVEGQYARELAAAGVRKGRDLVGLAKEVKELREQVAASRLREETLQNFFRTLGLAIPQPSNGNDTKLPRENPLNEGQRNAEMPPVAAFAPPAELSDSGANGSPFSFGDKPQATEGRPSFIANLAH